MEFQPAQRDAQGKLVAGPTWTKPYFPHNIKWLANAEPGTLVTRAAVNAQLKRNEDAKKTEEELKAERLQEQQRVAKLSKAEKDEEERLADEARKDLEVDTTR